MMYLVKHYWRAFHSAFHTGDLVGFTMCILYGLILCFIWLNA